MQSCNACIGVSRSRERIGDGNLLLASGAFPQHAGIALEGDEGLVAVRPFRRLLEMQMIARLAPGAPGEDRARDVDHLGRMRALIGERRSALRAEAAHRA